MLGIRLFGFLVLPLGLLHVVPPPDADGRSGAPMVANFLRAVLWSAIFYGRMAVHMRDVAAPPPDSPRPQ